MKEFLAIVAVFVIAPFLFLWFLLGIRIEPAEQNVSGVVYNTTNNAWLSGNTRFSVRASEDTVVSEENRSSYCLPPGSPYIALVNEAAKNKTMKVSVTTSKVLTVTTPWGCVDNVTVERIQ